MADPIAPKDRVNLERAVILRLANETGLDMLGRIFGGFGVRFPCRCSTAERAMEICREVDVDLIVCDGSLPEGQDYDFIANPRRGDLESNRFAPVLVVAGHTPIDQVEKARDCGAHFVVAKPLAPRTLLERVVWIAQESRPFIEFESHIGPDRRFQDVGPPKDGQPGRRRSDKAAAPAPTINLRDALL